MLSNANAKLSEYFSKYGYKVMSFGLNAIETCPFRGECEKGCYATQGSYKWSPVKKKRDNNLRYSKLDDFITCMNYHLEQARPKRGNKELVIRIHDSGDFYRQSYANKWIEIAEQNKDVHFYAYTKSVRYFKDNYDRLPDNLKIIFSFGGKEDHLIDTDKHAHCHIFSDSELLKKSGYEDASNNDMVAAFSETKRIGVVYHGYNSKEWSTDQSFNSKKVVNY